MSATDKEINLAQMEHSTNSMWQEVVDQLCSSESTFDQCMFEYNLMMRLYKITPALPQMPAMLLCYAMAALTTEAVRRGVAPLQAIYNHKQRKEQIDEPKD